MPTDAVRRPDDAEARYRAMFDQSPLPMWMYDRATLRIVAVNEAAIRHYGYSREELESLTLEDLRPPEDVAALHADVSKASGLTTGPQRWRHRKKDGTLITVEVNANDFQIDGRDVRLVLIQDVTEREEAARKLRATEEQLRHAQKMDALGRLAGGVAHDINNVLTAIEGYACFLEEGLEHGDTRREDAVEIRRATERAAGITRQLLTLSRKGKTSVQVVDVTALVTQFAPMLRRLIGEQVELVVKTGPAPSVLADRGHLEQAIMNIAINARDAMPGGGQLTIETGELEVDAHSSNAHRVRPGRYLVIALTDTGTGMDLETQQRIFEPFFTTKEAGRGTGLGLAIVHGVVTQAGGAVTVYSEPGHGTTFRILLPVAEGDSPQPREPTHAAPATLPPITILVVDDDHSVRTVAARILAEAGCTVLEAASVEEARHVAVSHDGTIHLLLTDVVLAGGRGEVLAEELRRLRPAMTCLLMSGYPAGALAAAGGGCSDLLAKPFSPTELRGAVAAAIGDDHDHRRISEPQILPRVLLADDDDVLRRTLARVLRRAALEVVEVESGTRAIEELRASRFDVVITDIEMPGKTGLDLLRAVRDIDLDIPVILITGAPDLAMAAAAVEYGAFRFLTKPVDNADIAKLAQRAARAVALARIRRKALTVTGGGTGGIVDRAGLEARFEKAIDALWVAFQPIVDARSGVSYAVEALMRSDEPAMASPGELLAAADSLVRLPELARRVWTLAAAGVQALPAETQLFVNLHPDDLLDAELVNERSPLAAIAPRVVLEITERACLTTSAKITERLHRLRQLGFRIAVDDIGAGYSGLTSFTQLEPEIVKIDLTLVRDVHLSALKQRTIAALVRLCHETGSLVVAEGIETPAERDCVAALGCDLLQGFLIGRPARAPSR